jgi:hypothetical protein
MTKEVYDLDKGISVFSLKISIELQAENRSRVVRPNSTEIPSFISLGVCIEEWKDIFSSLTKKQSSLFRILSRLEEALLLLKNEFS